ncbi:MAG TPA: CoB--CoM heterodisulfide reductase iron-sulfur subunit A family protein [Chloroflexi bacterium]|nr:CoB--CoM heterodisulfide reductase iron-sulfur subunit A family protein [Chloroflexota bacterium]
MSEPKIGVYVCDCGINIAATIKVADVLAFAQRLPNVVVARENKYMCSEPGQQMIQDDIRDLGLDRIVVASCTPRMHETTFQNAVAEAGLNPYYFAMANIREHVSWVVPDVGQATAKAKRLISSTVHRVTYQSALEPRQEPVTQSAMIIGAGIAGIQAALTIAEAGYPVYLVEREPSIGGHMAELDKTFPTLDCST